MSGSIVGSLLSTVAFTAGVAGFAACSSDGESREQIAFSAVTRQHRQIMVEGAMGALESNLVGFVLYFEPEARCPSSVVSERSIAIRGGCTDDDGVAWVGEMSATFTLTSMSIDFDDFGTVGEGSQLVVDGEVDVGENLHSDIVATYEAYSLAVDATWEGGFDKLAAGSTFELLGSGYADGAGQWDISEPFGALELRGIDLLRVDFASLDFEDCAAATLDGVPAGRICLGGEDLVQPLRGFRAALARAPR